jgi:hypothetical protein
MLGAGNATAATLFVAYHVSPDVRLRLPELRRGELLRTALGSAARLMVDRVEDAADDFSHGYDDGPGGEAVVRGVGSQAGVLGGGVDACNGRVFVVDRVLLPVDVDGVTTPEQKAHADAIRRAVEAEARTGRGGARRRRDGKLDATTTTRETFFVFLPSGRTCEV